MGSCISNLFTDLQIAYEQPNRVPPLDSIDKHIIPRIWNILLGAFYIALILVQWLYFQDIGNIIFFPMVFFTAWFCYRKYQLQCLAHQLNPEQTKFADLYRAFCHCMWGGSVFALISEMFQAVIYTLIITGGDVQNEGKDTGWKVQMLTLVNAFIIAGMTEEMTKAIILQHCTKLYLPHPVNLDGSYIKTYVWMGLATGLGFGTMEGILYTCFYGMSYGWLGQLIIVLIRVFLAIPFHTLTGIMWGMELSRRECLKEPRGWFQLGIKQVLWHGLYDYVEMEYSLFTPQNDIALSFLGLVLGYIIVLIALFVTRRSYNKLTLHTFSSLRENSHQVQEMVVIEE